MNPENIAEKLNRASDSHKGQNGKVLVIGGSEKFTGAPALSAEACLRAGADLVKILTHEENRKVVASYSKDFIVESYGQNFDRNSLEKARKLERWADVTVVGPGFEVDSEALKDFLSDSGRLVIDAECIEQSLDVSDAVFTPHKEEAEVISSRFGSLENFSIETDNTVLLTSKKDEIFHKGEKYVNETGCPAMTVGGTGDVLTGIVASLRSQGLRKKEAAYFSAYLNGKAGEKAEEKFGNGLKASDLPEEVAKILESI